MARGGFLNDNAHRSYPFLDAALGMPLPESTITDFGCVMGLDAEYDDLDHQVYLHSIDRLNSGTFLFHFRTTAPRLYGRSLTFVVPDDSPELSSFTAQEDVAPGSSGSSVSSDFGDDPAWEGFLVIGDLTDLKNVIAPNDNLADTDGATAVEPARIQNLARTALRAVHLGNIARTVISAADGCAPIDSPAADPEKVLPYTRGLAGVLTMLEGFNCVIRQVGTENTIVIGAGVGAGAGQPCDEIPLQPYEASPDGGRLLTGGPTCGQVLKSINGVGGKIIRLNNGTGVRITPGESEGQLIVAVDLHDLAVCRTSSITV